MALCSSDLHAMAAYVLASTNLIIKSIKNKFQVTDSEIIRKRDIQLFAFAYSVYGDTHPCAAFLESFASVAEVATLKDQADTGKVF